MKKVLLLCLCAFGTLSMNAQFEYSYQPHIFFTAPEMDSCDLKDTIIKLPLNKLFTARIGTQVFVIKKIQTNGCFPGDFEKKYQSTITIVGDLCEPDYFMYTERIRNTSGKIVGFTRDVLMFHSLEPLPEGNFIQEGIWCDIFFSEILERYQIPWEKVGWLYKLKDGV